MRKVFVSGCYDILHAGHIQFFEEAKAKGDYLIVCYCSSENLKLYKGRESSLPDDNKMFVLKSIRYVDEVVIGNDDGGVWDFVPAFLLEKPDMLVVTEDDKHSEEKRKFCEEHNTEFIVLPKTAPVVTSTSTTEIIKKIRKQGGIL